MPWQCARHRKSLLAHFVMNTKTKREIPYVCLCIVDMPWQRARRRKSVLAHFVMNTETKREIPYVCRSSNIAIASHCPSNSLASPCICLVQHGVPWHKNFQIQLTKSSPLSNFQKVFLRDHLSALWNLQVKNLSISGAKSIFGVFKELWRTLFSCQR